MVVPPRLDRVAPRGRASAVAWVLGVSTLVISLQSCTATIFDESWVEREWTLLRIWWGLADRMPAWGALQPAHILLAISVVLFAGFAAGLWLLLANAPAAPRDDGQSRPMASPADGHAAFGHRSYRDRLRPEIAVRTSADWLSIGLLALLAIAVAYRVGAFDLWGTVDSRSGGDPAAKHLCRHRSPVSRGARRDAPSGTFGGCASRWIAHHQGGYPVEFYPLGVAWLEVGVWALAAGVLPIASVHTLVVVLIFLAPPIALALIARRDGLPPSVGIGAAALHVLLPGGPWQGGYAEIRANGPRDERRRGGRPAPGAPVPHLLSRDRPPAVGIRGRGRRGVCRLLQPPLADRSSGDRHRRVADLCKAR